MGDSAFSSLSTVLALLQRQLYHVGALKTSPKGFSDDYLQRWCQKQLSLGKPIGGQTALKTTFKTLDVLALTHNGEERKIRIIISSLGEAQNPNGCRRRTNLRLCFEIYYCVTVIHNQPKVIEEYNKYSNAVDDNNRLRQKD